MRSVKRLQSGLSVPKQALRQRTACRSSRSARFFVGGGVFVIQEDPQAALVFEDFRADPARLVGGRGRGQGEEAPDAGLVLGHLFEAKIRPAAEHSRSPYQALEPPRSIIAWKSRSRCSQQNW